jgi:hypothetical protein
MFRCVLWPMRDRLHSAARPGTRARINPDPFLSVLTGSTKGPCCGQRHGAGRGHGLLGCHLRGSRRRRAGDTPGHLRWNADLAPRRPSGSDHRNRGRSDLAATSSGHQQREKKDSWARSNWGLFGAVCRRLRELPRENLAHERRFSPTTAVSLVNNRHRLTEEAADEPDRPPPDGPAWSSASRPMMWTVRSSARERLGGRRVLDPADTPSAASPCSPAQDGDRIGLVNR